MWLFSNQVVLSVISGSRPRSLASPAVKGSKDELWQVLVNLLSNAIDSIGQNGVIRVRAKTTRNPTSGIYKVRLTVADNGCGIDQKNGKKIFEAFFTTKGAVSSGLGLWIARERAD